MTDHSDATELALFVHGQLDGARRASFEAHVAGCAACSAELAREAQLELVLRDLGERGELAWGAPGRGARIAVLARRHVRGLGIAAAVMAAAAVLLVWRGTRPGAPAQATAARAIPGVVCAAGPDQLACVQRAHRHGLFVRYPAWGGPALGGIDAGRRAQIEPASRARGPSAPPFPTAEAEL